jgi:hypothetical protein
MMLTRIICLRLLKQPACCALRLALASAGNSIAAKIAMIAMTNLKQFEVWFVTGSQHLYGPETLKKVAEHSQEIAKALNAAPAIPVKVVFKPVLTTPDAITALCQAANNAPKCIGLITWCHTFSPSKMWINGLKQLAQAGRAPAHAIQPRHSVGHD